MTDVWILLQLLTESVQSFSSFLNPSLVGKHEGRLPRLPATEHANTFHFRTDYKR